MARSVLTDAELQLDVDAYYDNGGNKAEAARARGLKRQTYNDRLRTAQKRLGIVIGKVADGRINIDPATKLRLPKKGQIKRYMLTSIQNNTHLHPGFHNLVTYCDWLDNLENGSCELMVGTFSYQAAIYGPKAVKRGTHVKQDKELWYATEAEEFIVDRNMELAPGLVWCGKMNILPTNKHPLTDFEAYNGRKSNLVPHAKIAMESVASMADEATKFNYSTGTITQLNYIQKRIGILSEQNHDYGALLVEVDSDGNWWVRQLYIGRDDEIMDLGPDGYAGVVVRDGEVKEEVVVDGINWGDAHAAEMELWVRELAWGKDGMLDTLQAKYQFMNDLFSMRSRGHHDMKNFHRTYEKHVDGEESVQDEMEVTAELLREAERDFCETIVVPSNHDRHLDRWLNEADFRLDPINAKYFCQLQYEVLDAMDRGDRDFNVLEWALREEGCPEEVRFLAEEESFILNGVEHGLHGDLGPNGAGGSTQALTRLGRPINKGHDHRAAIRMKVFSAAACALDFPYMRGPNSHSISHIGTYANGTRTIITMWAGKYRAV